MKKQRNTFQMREQDKTLEENLNERELSNLPEKEFKVIVIKMLTELGRRIDEHSENFNKAMENIRKYQIDVTQLKSIITEKYTRRVQQC